MGIFREEGFNNGDDEKGYYMFPYRKSDKKCLHEDITLYYKDLVEDRMLESEYYLKDQDQGKTPDELVDDWSREYAGLTYWKPDGLKYICDDGMFEFVREATADDMKRKDWNGDGVKSQSLILPTTEVADDEVTREELRDLVKKVSSRTSFPETHVDALKQLYEEEQAFIEKAKSSIVSAMELFPYEDKGYDFHRDGFNLISSKVQFKEVGDNTITIIENYGDQEEAELLFMYGNKSMTARLSRYSCESEPNIVYEGDHEEIGELFDDENQILESFLERYDLCYVPE